MDSTEPTPFTLFQEFGSAIYEQVYSLDFIYLAAIPFVVIIVFFMGLFVARRLSASKEKAAIAEFEKSTTAATAANKETEDPGKQIAEAPDEHKAVPDKHETVSVTESKPQAYQSGLAKSRSFLSEKLTKIFTGKTTIDESVLEGLHEQLYRADMGVKTVDKLVASVRKKISSNDGSNIDHIKSA